MITVKEDSALIGVAELRTNAANVLKEIKTHKVILTRRNKPVGVIIDYDQYENIELLVDKIEDIVLGNIAKERLNRRNKKLLPLEEVERKVGLR